MSGGGDYASRKQLSSSKNTANNKRGPVNEEELRTGWAFQAGALGLARSRGASSSYARLRKSLSHNKRSPGAWP
jgi:hypothetical protein